MSRAWSDSEWNTIILFTPRCRSFNLPESGPREQEKWELSFRLHTPDDSLENIGRIFMQRPIDDTILDYKCHWVACEPVRYVYQTGSPSLLCLPAYLQKIERYLYRSGTPELTATPMVVMRRGPRGYSLSVAHCFPELAVFVISSSFPPVTK